MAGLLIETVDCLDAERAIARTDKAEHFLIRVDGISL